MEILGFASYNLIGLAWLLNWAWIRLIFSLQNVIWAKRCQTLERKKFDQVYLEKFAPLSKFTRRKKSMKIYSSFLFWVFYCSGILVSKGGWNATRPDHRKRHLCGRPEVLLSLEKAWYRPRRLAVANPPYASRWRWYLLVPNFHPSAHFARHPFTSDWWVVCDPANLCQSHQNEIAKLFHSVQCCWGFGLLGLQCFF